MSDSFNCNQITLGDKQYLAVNCRHYISGQATSKPASYTLYNLSGNLNLATLGGALSPAGFGLTALGSEVSFDFDTAQALLYVPSDYNTLVIYTSSYGSQVGATTGYTNYLMEPIEYGMNYWHSDSAMPGYGVNNGKYNDAQCEALMQVQITYNTQCPLWVNVQSFTASMSLVSGTTYSLSLNMYMKRWVKPSSGHPYNLFNFCVLIPLK